MNLLKIKLPSLSGEQKKEMLRAALVLLAVCASCALLLSGLFSLLSGWIEENTASALTSAMTRILPADEYVQVDFENKEEDKVVSVYEARSADALLGYCVETTAQDYDGKMTVCVAVDTDDKVIAVEIISLSGKGGGGSKIKDSSFLTQFEGKSGTVTAVKGTPKTEAQVSAVSGATTSSQAVAECVNHAVAAVSQLEAEKAKEAAGI